MVPGSTGAISACEQLSSGIEAEQLAGAIIASEQFYAGTDAEQLAGAINASEQLNAGKEAEQSSASFEVAFSMEEFFRSTGEQPQLQYLSEGKADVQGINLLREGHSLPVVQVGEEPTWQVLGKVPRKYFQKFHTGDFQPLSGITEDRSSKPRRGCRGGSLKQAKHYNNTSTVECYFGNVTSMSLTVVEYFKELLESCALICVAEHHHKDSRAFQSA